MKLKFSCAGIGLVLTAFISSTAYAEFGVCDYGKETISSLHCFGSAQLNGTTVTGKVFIAGSLEATNATIDQLYVAGDATLNNSIVKKSTEVEGALAATASQFKDSVYIASPLTQFTNSLIDGPVTIKSTDTTPYLQLNCNTQINSSVNFDGKAGMVSVSDKSKVNGTIKNGLLSVGKKSASCKSQSLLRS